MTSFIAVGATLATVLFAEDEPSRFYFDNGAEQYTRDDIEKARAWVAEGLTLYPDDQKLILLKQLLEQQQQQQQQQPPPQQQSQQDEKNSQSGQQPQADPLAQPPPSIENPSSAEDQPRNKPEEFRASEMTPEEAERLMDAMRDREASDRARAAIDRLRRETRALPPVEKDW